jgi:hypothetical protein
MKNKHHKKTRLRRIDVNVEELDQIVDRARQAPLSYTDYDKLKTALHALIERLPGRGRRRSSHRYFRMRTVPHRQQRRGRKARRDTDATAHSPSLAHAN